MTTATRIPPEKIALSYRDVVQATSLARRTIVRMVSMGTFPRPRRVGTRALFSAAEVRAWFERQPTAAEVSNGR